MIDDLLAGIYRHYKGPLYEVSGLAHDANNEDRESMVLYRGLQLDGAHLGPRWAVRNWSDFDAHVMVGDNQLMRRFTYLGPMLTAEMLEG